MLKHEPTVSYSHQFSEVWYTTAEAASLLSMGYSSRLQSAMVSEGDSVVLYQTEYDLPRYQGFHSNLANSATLSTYQ